MVQIVEGAKEYNVALVPFGGGTSVSWAVAIPRSETRVIAVIDTSQMVRAFALNDFAENLILAIISR